jgi:serine/threonine protein kinase
MITAASQSPIETLIAGNAADVAVESTTASVIAGYDLGQRLGAGGMGVVYLVHQRSTGRPCAAKLMKRGQGAAAVARFRFEIDVLEQLAHPHIVQLVERGCTEAGDEYVAMEYVAGGNLDAHVARRGPLAARRVVTVLRQLCSALGAVHAHGLVHGDVKPANVVLAGQGGSRVKLIDFGLARPAGDHAEAAAPQAASTFAGSPLYAPPEAMTGAVDARSDIYSLGATAYFLLTGRPVFDEARPLAAILAHAERTPAAVSTVQPSVPAAMEAIVMKCLAKNPTDRFQSADELDAALAKVESELLTAQPNHEARRAGAMLAQGGAKRSPGCVVDHGLRSPNGAALNREHKNAPSSAPCMFR